MPVPRLQLCCFVGGLCGKLALVHLGAWFAFLQCCCFELILRIHCELTFRKINNDLAELWPASFLVQSIVVLACVLRYNGPLACFGVFDKRFLNIVGPEFLGLGNVSGLLDAFWRCSSARGRLW